MKRSDDLDLLTQLDQAWDLIAQGDFEGAMHSAKRSLEIDDASPEAHNLIGYIHATGGNLDAALESYRTAIEYDSEFLEAILNAAEVLLQIGNFEAAIAQTIAALEVVDGPDERADVMLLQVDALLALGKAKRAEEVVRSLPQGPFRSAQIDFLVGRALFEVGDVEHAAIPIEHAAAVTPRDPEVWYYLGLVREGLGDIRGATAAFLQTRELDRAFPRPPWSESREQFEQRVQGVIQQLPLELSSQLEGALVLIDDLPGAEVVSEGFDPRQPVLLDDLDLGRGETLRRAFIYQRSIERLSPGAEYLDETLTALITAELNHVFGN